MTQDPRPVVADYITARVQASSFGVTSINGRAQIARIEGTTGFSLHDNGFFHESRAILKLDSRDCAGAIYAAALVSGDTPDIARGITTSLVSPILEGAYLTTSSAITKYCADVCPDQHELIANHVQLRELCVRDPSASALVISGSCALRSQMTPICASEVQLPSAESGRIVEYMPPPQRMLIVRNIASVIPEQWISYGQALTFISDGTQWFALDAFGRKYSQ